MTGMCTPPDRSAAAIDDEHRKGDEHERFVRLCEREYEALCMKSSDSAEKFLLEWVSDEWRLLAHVFHLANRDHLTADELGRMIRELVVRPVIRHAAELVAEKGR